MLRMGVILLCVVIVLLSVGVAVQSHPARAKHAKSAGAPDGGPAPSPVTAQIDAPALRMFTLQTGIVEGRMVFVGVGGEIDGEVNPDLVVDSGEPVHLVVVNGDGMAHDLVIPDLDAATPIVVAKGDSAQLVFTPVLGQNGAYAYFCSVSGHRQAGMAGRLIVR